MADIRLRDLERKARTTGDWNDILAVRIERKRLGMSDGLDLSLPHKWDVLRVDGSYAEGLGILRAVCAADVAEKALHPFEKGVIRPLTFKENIQARIAQYKAMGKAGSLWDNRLNSSTAIVYRKGTTKFKIVQLSEHLLTLAPSFRNPFLQVRYADFKQPELDMSDFIYNEDLTQEQIVNPLETDPKKRYHAGWLAAVDGDGALLEEYAGLVFGLLGSHRAMTFLVDSNSEEDALSTLSVNFFKADSGCDGVMNLNGRARFARVCPP